METWSWLDYVDYDCDDDCRILIIPFAGVSYSTWCFLDYQSSLSLAVHNHYDDPYPDDPCCHRMNDPDLLLLSKEWLAEIEIDCETDCESGVCFYCWKQKRFVSVSVLRSLRLTTRQRNGCEEEMLS